MMNINIIFLLFVSLALRLQLLFLFLMFLYLLFLLHFLLLPRLCAQVLLQSPYLGLHPAQGHVNAEPHNHRVRVHCHVVTIYYAHSHTCSMEDQYSPKRPG